MSKNETPVAACNILSRGPGVDLQKQNPGLHILLDRIMTAFKRREMEDFHKLFHPRARVKKNIGGKIESILRHRYDLPWQFSVFRVWSLEKPDKAKAIYECPETTEAEIVSRYGYAHQYAVWIQLMGQNELGRIHLSIAPNPKKELVIVGFHIQQWTLGGENWEYWTRKGNQLLEQKDELHAYLAYDVAHKLLEGGDFAKYPVREEIKKQRDLIIDDKELLAKVQKISDKTKVAYVASALNRGGLGIFVRLRLEKNQGMPELQERCQYLGRKLIEAKWLLDSYSGLRCSFLLPGEKADKDGHLGGFYYTLAQIKKSSG